GATDRQPWKGTMGHECGPDPLVTAPGPRAGAAHRTIRAAGTAAGRSCRDAVRGRIRGRGR
ncbi:hypothetical protein LI165_14290, partial [Phascolarctobacterium faecium]|nr:hypothetical protein [Phascolarctobacterium faecium]